MTLYLKYRPQKISELDLTSVREQLTKIISSEEMPHAFLFSGPRGTGKTSAARILAKVVNCDPPSPGLRKGMEPCNKCEQCLAITRGVSMDVVEIDAASNRGIDDVRALRENVALSPASAKKKVYIIDEAHMLTTEAANAFLKTLEEPPSHAMFILATTDPWKLPATIHSRLVNITFSKASGGEIERQLQRAIKGEKFAVEDGVIELIAGASDGSFRDAVKILESLGWENKKITYELAKKHLDRGRNLAGELMPLLEQKKMEESLEFVGKYSRDGGDARELVDGLILGLRDKLLSAHSTGSGLRGLVSLVESLIEARARIPASPVPVLPLEIAIVKWMGRNAGGEGGVEKVVGQACLTKQTWERIKNEVKEKNFTVDALLRAVHPISFDGGSLRVGVYYKFHKERLEDGENKRFLEDVIGGVLGCPVKIICDLSEREVPSAAALTVEAPQDIIDIAREVFEN